MHAIRETKVAFDSSFDDKEQVRQAIDIVDLLGKYNLQLRRQGRGYVTHCPWHDDTRPSLQVNPERQSWKCWPCDIGGDIFSFVMKMEGVDFPEALAMLADRAGITLQKPSGCESAFGEQGPSAPSPLAGGGIDKRTLYKAAAWVECQYHECLLHAARGRAGPKVLSRRGISAESIERFQLGFAPLDRDWILKQAGGSPSRAKVLETIGVLRRSSAGGSLYDLFRGRGLFAIRDAQGRPVGMGGRLLPGVETFLPGKYVNSPETPLFRKSHLLYGLDLAKEAIHKSKSQDGPGDGGLYRRHRRPSVRLQQRRGRAGRGLGRNPHQDPEAVRRPHRPRARRRRSRARSGPTKSWSCSSPSRSICRSSRCPTISTRAISSSSAGPRPSPSCWQRARRRPGPCLPFGHARARPGSRHSRRQPGPGTADRDSRQGPAIAARYDERRPPAGREFLQRFAALFRVSETEVRRRLTTLRRRVQERGPATIAAAPGGKIEPAWRPGDTIDACERELAELLVVYPEHGPRPARRLLPSELARPRCGGYSKRMPALGRRRAARF